jgi:hypothetical protein
MTGVVGQRDAVLENIKSIERQIAAGRTLSEDDRLRLQGQRSEQVTKLASLNAQINLFEEKKKKLEVLSPIDGRITTWDVERTLMGRTVRSGQIMLSVAEPAYEWELELNMPEDRMGHIRRAQDKLGEHLQVSYILATDPGKTHVGTVREVALGSEPKAEEGVTVMIRVDVNKQDLLDSTGLPELRPGATVKAQVNCGRCSIGYRYFHDLIGWFQTQIFKFF